MTQKPAPAYVFRRAAQVLTFLNGPFPGPVSEKEIGIKKQATVVVHRGRVQWVGADEDYNPRDLEGDPIIEFDVRDHVILPGLCDPHTHLIYGGHRLTDWMRRWAGADYEEIAAQGGGILSTVKATRATRDDRLRQRLGQRLDWLLSQGVTTVEIKTGYGLNERDEFRLLRLLMAANQTQLVTVVPTFMPAHAIPPDQHRDRYLNQILERWIPTVARSQWARYTDVFCDRGYFSVDETLDILNVAREYGLPVRLHADELSHTGLLETVDDWSGIHAVDHLDHMDPAAASVLAEHEVAAGLLPTTWFHLGLPRPPLEALLKAGAYIALGSDHNPGTNPVLNPWYTLWIACVGWNIPVHMALAWMTVNAAYSLRVHGRVGRLRPGAWADLVVIDVPHYGYLAYQWDAVPVKYVVKNGRPYRIREPAEIHYTWMQFEPQEVPED